MRTDVLIVGGGLAGLALARALTDAGREWLLIEARDRLGGRVLSAAVAGAEDAFYDLGPAWFWPGQPRMERLVHGLGLEAFEQYAEGTLVLEERDGAVRRDLDFATMGGSLRLVGGVARLTASLAAGLPSRSLLLGHRLRRLAMSDGGVLASIETDGRELVVDARKVVLALPSRLVAKHVQFEPALSRESLEAMRSVPTWMAGHAKLIAVYRSPFWRDAGLSGDGMSRRGPLVEIHDASPASAGQGALFGFIGIPAPTRANLGDELAKAAVAQLTAMFGPQAAEPLAVLGKDWAFEPCTATDADQLAPYGHPAYGTPAELRGLWEGRLLLASSEMARQFGGFLEGALEAAEQAASVLAGIGNRA